MAARTHYDELGIRSDASDDAVRDAYRRLAREFHPDRTAGSAAGGDRMPAINEAYRVLSDPGRRAVYDASLRGGPVIDRSGGRDVDLDDDQVEVIRPVGSPPRLPDIRVPWRTLLVCTGLAIVAVFVLAQFTEPGEPIGPDGILRGGDCVEVLADGRVGEISCTGDGDLVVRALVPFDGECRSGWNAYQDRQGMGLACVEQT
ncbi:MAG: J domain-containing protein [Actinomycetota bacterium]